MFIYKIKPTNIKCRYDAHRIVSSMFKKSIYTINEQGFIIVRTSEVTYNTPYDGSEVVSFFDCGEVVIKNNEQYMFNIDVYAQCIMDNKFYSVPKEKVTDWMKNKFEMSGFEVLDITKHFLGCENIQITKGKSFPTPINRFVGVLKVINQINANEALLKGFGKRKHLGLGCLELIR